MGRIVTTADVKGYTGTKRDENDDFIERLIQGSESSVERFCQRQFSPDPALVAGDPPVDTAPMVTKKFATRGMGSITLPDLRVAASITFGGQVLAMDFTYALENRPHRYFSSVDSEWHDEPYTTLNLSELAQFVEPTWLYVEGQRDMEIKGRWGFYPTPDDVKDAVCQLVARRFKKKDANWSDSLQVGPIDGGGSTFNYIKSLPAEVQETLTSYRLPKIALV